MGTIFTKIIEGEIPCHKVWEDENHFAFLDINPRTAGHTLVVPKRETKYLFDLDDDAHAALWNAAKTVAARLKEITRCGRVCVAVVGWEVPHVHIHLMPTNEIADFPMPPPRPMSQDDLAALAKELEF